MMMMMMPSSCVCSLFKTTKNAIKSCADESYRASWVKDVCDSSGERNLPEALNRAELSQPDAQLPGMPNGVVFII